MRKQYIGVKQITAKPAANPAGDGTEPGYDVYYVQPDGGEYRSWSPKEVFEKAYRETTGLTFGLAIEALKLGYRVARQGWNGKGMYLKLVQEDWYELLDEKFPEFKRGPEWNLDPFIMMKTATGSLVPWLASQSDMLAEDWVIIQ